MGYGRGFDTLVLTQDEGDVQLKDTYSVGPADGGWWQRCNPCCEGSDLSEFSIDRNDDPYFESSHCALIAPDQERILAVFQEESWPDRIDDPLPPVPGITPKRRLHSTIQCLNRNQKTHLLQFHGDGCGCGVRWELLPSEWHHAG